MKYFNVGFVVFNVVSLVSALHRVYSHRLQHQSALSTVTVVTVRNKTKRNTSFILYFAETKVILMIVSGSL